MQPVNAIPGAGGRMTEGEARFCAALDHAAGDVLAGRMRFSEFVRRLWFDFQVLRRHRYDLDAAIRLGATFTLTGSPPADHPTASLTLLEEQFLKDLEGLTQFATRNGIEFTNVLSILAHDINNIYFAGSDLSRLEAEGFRPKVMGWAKRNVERAGEPVE